MSIQAHPHYHEGYFDAMSGDPIFDDCTPEYRAGWEAAWQAKEIFANAGLKNEGGSFSASGTIKKDAAA